MNLKLRHGDIEWMIGEKEDGRIEVDEVVEEGRAGGGEKKAAWCKVQLPNSASERIIAKNGWNTLLRQEKKLELVRMRNYRQWTSATDGEVEQTSLALPTASMSVRESKDQDGGLEESLQDLGLLKDVVQLLQELESTPTIRGDDGTRCWPYMRRMAIYSGNRQGETFKNEYERLLEAVIKTEKAKAEKNERRLFAGIRGLVEGFFQA
ncbi:hypothetical protein EC991_003419 [Linnemannia zychae]|nr:hypothetical protein EC991_003419 [Linnemannia zychae]